MIASTAVIDPEAKLASDVSVGHYSVIGSGVEISSGTKIGNHVVIEGPTYIGTNNSIAHHAVLGGPPQDLKYKGEPTRLEIGNDNLIREFATIHRGTMEASGVTRVGNKNMIMAYAHIAHDCQIGNNIILANAVNMAGHVHIEDFVTIGGICAIHQFVRIGRYAFIGGFSAISQDVIPFAMVVGERSSLRGINKIGLERRGFSPERRQALHTAVRYLLSKDLNTANAIMKITSEYPDNDDIRELIEFVKSSKRGICLA